MADPLAWRILEEIKTTLEGITVRNGYRRNVNKVTYKGLGWWEAKPDAIWISRERMPAVSEPVAATTTTLELRLICHVRDAENLDKAILVFSSDIIKALNVDETRSGLAAGTEVTNECDGLVVTSNNETTGVFGMDIEVLYDHQFGDPDTEI